MATLAASSKGLAHGRLQNKVAVVTGGASGIGENTVRLFVKHGAKVVIADIQDDLGHSLCDEINSDGAITYIHCDVSRESDVQNAVDMAVSKYGKLDIMFSNAGIPGSKRDGTVLGADTDYENFKRVFEVNVFGAFLCAKHAARIMIPAKKGSIIFTSSICSMTYGNVPHAYAASKSAVMGLTKNLCVDLGQYGIRVNCVSPFGVATPMLREALGGIEKEKVEDYVSFIANLKEAKLEANDVAEAVLYLGSDESKYISGVNLPIDGGYCTTNIALRQGKKEFFS